MVDAVVDSKAPEDKTTSGTQPSVKMYLVLNSAAMQSIRGTSAVYLHDLYLATSSETRLSQPIPVRLRETSPYTHRPQRNSTKTA